MFQNARPVQPNGESASYPVSYYLASAGLSYSATRWERVRYPGLYPGIDLVLVTNAGRLEYTFEISPEADPGQIRMRYAGAAAQLNRQGDLVAGFSGNRLRMRHPEAFQKGSVRNQKVPCSYRLDRGDAWLELGAYDHARALTIDPVVNFSTYLGGPSFDAIYAMAADSSGNLYVTGETNSGSLLGRTPGARTSRDAFAAKLNGAGTQVQYLVYVGGTGNDAGRGIAVDASGNAYVAGVTSSANFPTTAGAFSTQMTGLEEAFVTKFNSVGQIQYSTYLGGGSDSGLAIAVDSTGAAYVAGETAAATFPVTSGVIQSSNQGGLSDCFVAKLNAAGAALVYSTYLGGNALDQCAGIAVDSAGDAYVTGTTYSTNFPTQAAVQTSVVGAASAFVAELNPTATALLYSTYLGGSTMDNGNAIAIDSTGAAYVAGTTNSPDFPTTAGAFQALNAGVYNAFVAKLAPGGASLVYSTLLGGSGVDTATAIAVDSSGQAVVGGYTSSPNFPSVSPLQPAFQGIFDAFATVINVNGSGLVFSSYFGGSGDDRAYAVSALPGFVLALAGLTASTNFPTTAPLQSTFGGVYDGFALNAEYETVQTTTGGLQFYPITPCRVADTRTTSGFIGAFGPPSLAAATARSFPIQQSTCGVPVTAQAYSFNITVVPPAALTYLSVWPTGLPVPAATTLNSPSGVIVGNSAIASAGTNGAVSFLASNATDLVVDINGYFAPPSAQGLDLYPVTPCRVADTRSGSSLTGALGPPSLVAQGTRSFPIQSSNCSIPSFSEAYSIRFTVVPPGPLGFLAVWPAGLARPLVATLNDLKGNVIGNEALVPAGTGGAIDVFVTSATDVVIDINGYFAAPGNPGALTFHSLAPCRVADTQSTSGFTGAFGPPSIASGATRTFPMPSSACNIPATAQAYSLNLTVVPPGALGFITAWPTGQPLPLAATVNAGGAAVVGSAAIVPAGTGGAINVFANGLTDLLIDIDGYFGP